MLKKAMKKIRTALSAIIVAAIIVGAAMLIMKKPTPIPAEDLRIVAPPGWFVHLANAEGVLLTRQKELPTIAPGTEGFAYGEQIRAQSIAMNAPREDWVAARIPDDDPLYGKKEFGDIDGVTTLKVEHEVDAAGGELDYYVFLGDRAYVFSLFPVEPYDEAASKKTRNTAGLEAIDKIVREFITKMSR